MKKLFLILFTIFISLSAISQEIQKDIFELKVERYSKMKRKGITLGVIGGTLTTLGIVLLNQEEKTGITETGEVYTYTNSSGIVGLGGLATVAGVPLFVTGIILGVIGITKEKEYKSKLDHLSFQVKSTPQITGLSLVYNF